MGSQRNIYLTQASRIGLKTFILIGESLVSRGNKIINNFLTLTLTLTLILILIHYH